MKKILQITSFLLIFLIPYQAFAAECTLNTTPSPAIDSYKKNIETVIDAAKKAADASQCVKPAWSGSYMDVAIPAQSIKSLLDNVQSVGYNLGSLLSDIRYYFDASDTMLLPSVTEHQNSILEIQQEILKASIYIGSKCAQGVVTFTEDVSLDNATYKTKGRTLQVVLNDMYGQTTHVLVFFRNLVTNVSDREYLDETHFSIAPTGFANDMREFYSSENIQVCHDEDPKTQKIQEILKKSFTTGWKYPQAIQIWKDAFELLLYRSGQLTWSSTTDASKEAEINAIVQAQKWGVGNSRFLLNSQFFKEFGKRANNQTTQEAVKETVKRIAYETFGSLFRRQIIPDVAKSRANQSTVNIREFPQSDNDAQRLASIDKNLYSDYASRKVLIGQNKGQDPNTVVGLIQALEQLELTRPIVEELAKKICEIYNKQATNVPRPTCNDLMNNG